LVVVRFRMPAGIVESLVGGGNRVDDEWIDLAALFGLHPVVRLEPALLRRPARNQARDLAGEIVHLEIGHASDAALAGDDARPGGLSAAAERRHHADAGNDDAPHRAPSAPWTSRLPR